MLSLIKYSIEEKNIIGIVPSKYVKNDVIDLKSGENNEH